MRSTLPPTALTDSVRKTLESVNPSIRYSFQELESSIGESLNTERLVAMISGWFGILALLLTTIGLYGVISYLAALRTTEIGIRIAVGANKRHITLLVMKETAAVLAAGLIIGTGGSITIWRIGSALLYGLQSSDPRTIAEAGLTIVTFAVLASLFPARRATNIDPAITLKHE